MKNYGELYGKNWDCYQDAAAVWSYFDALGAYDEFRDVYDGRCNDLCDDAKNTVVMLKYMADFYGFRFIYLL